MRIAKYLNHLGVDTMLKTVLGDDLTIFRWQDPTPWIQPDNIRFRYVDGDVTGQDWDIFMFDDMMTVHYFKLSGARARCYVWYCHGSFTRWPVAQEFFNKYFNDFQISAIFTDDHKRTLVDEWRTFDIWDSITLPIALDPGYFSELCQEKNGRIAIIGNDYNKVCANYPRYDTFARPAIEHVLDRYQDLVDVYGHNSAERNDIFGDRRLGSAKIRDLGEYSMSLHLSGVASVGFVLLECFAAGIPVMATPKYQLPRDGSWIPLVNLDQMSVEIDRLLGDPGLCLDLGQRGQQMVERCFTIDRYRDQIVPWLESRVNSRRSISSSRH